MQKTRKQLEEVGKGFEEVGRKFEEVGKGIEEVTDNAKGFEAHSDEQQNLICVPDPEVYFAQQRASGLCSRKPT